MFSEWDWDKEGKEVNEYLQKFNGDFDSLFQETTPTDLDDLINLVMGKAPKTNKDKRKKSRRTKTRKDTTQDNNRITLLMEKYDLPCHYIIDEFIIGDQIIDPDCEQDR